MLKEEVIFAFVVEQSVGVIHPVSLRGEMKLRAVFFVAELTSWMRYHGGYLILEV